MDRKWEQLHKVLRELGGKQYNQDLPELNFISAIIISGRDDEVYLRSDVFWYHCKLLGLMDKLVLDLIKETRKVNNV